MDDDEVEIVLGNNENNHNIFNSISDLKNKEEGEEHFLKIKLNTKSKSDESNEMMASFV